MKFEITNSSICPWKRTYREYFSRTWWTFRDGGHDMCREKPRKSKSDLLFSTAEYEEKYYKTVIVTNKIQAF